MKNYKRNILLNTMVLILKTFLLGLKSGSLFIEWSEED